MFRTRSGMAIAAGMVFFAILAFTLSFVSLNELAQRMGHPPVLSWIYPILVDGLAIFSTLGIFWRHDYEADAKYEWFLLVVTSLLSLAGNVANALPENQAISQPIKIILAGIPPVLLVFIIHTVVRNIRFSFQSPKIQDITPLNEIEITDTPPARPEYPHIPTSETFTPSIESSTEPSIESSIKPGIESVIEPGIESGIGSGLVEGKKASPAPRLRIVDTHANSQEDTISNLAKWILEEENAGNKITGTQVAQHFNLPLSTAKRHLKQAREQLESNDEIKENVG